MTSHTKQRSRGNEALHPKATAISARLRYVNADEPGMRRVKRGNGFTYVDAAGRRVVKKEVLDRIRHLAIPPAWGDVWICSDERGHIQVIGRDAKGRKQYRYHTQWVKTRSVAKYHHLLSFAEVLPSIRKRVDADLALPGLSRSKVLAAAVRLLDEAHVRVGNEEYAKANHSFGLTTLRDRHVKVRGSTIAINFRGKSGKFHHIELHDRRLAKVMKRCQDLPGQILFQFIDEAGETHHVTSSDVNDYLRDTANTDITSKDFRTWAASVEVLRELRGAAECTLVRERKRSIMNALENAANLLGNTVAVCRKSYVHPHVVEHYAEGTLAAAIQVCARKHAVKGLTKDETCLVDFLCRDSECDATNRKAA